MSNLTIVRILPNSSTKAACDSHSAIMSQYYNAARSAITADTIYRHSISALVKEAFCTRVSMGVYRLVSVQFIL